MSKDNLDDLRLKAVQSWQKTFTRLSGEMMGALSLHPSSSGATIGQDRAAPMHEEAIGWDRDILTEHPATTHVGDVSSTSSSIGVDCDGEHGEPSCGDECWQFLCDDGSRHRWDDGGSDGHQMCSVCFGRL